MPSETYTQVVGPDHITYLVLGKITRSEAIGQARRHYEREREKANDFLGCADSELQVEVVRGVWKQKVLEKL